MPIRLAFGIDVGVSSDSRGYKDLGNFVSKIRSDTYTEGGSQRTIIAGGESDKLIPLDDIANVGFILLKIQPEDENEAGQVISVKFNDVVNDSHAIHPVGGQKVGYFLWTTDSLTALYVTNAGTVSVAMTMILAGD